MEHSLSFGGFFTETVDLISVFFYPDVAADILSVFSIVCGYYLC